MAGERRNKLPFYDLCYLVAYGYLQERNSRKDAITGENFILHKEWPG